VERPLETIGRREREGGEKERELLYCHALKEVVELAENTNNGIVSINHFPHNRAGIKELKKKLCFSCTISDQKIKVIIIFKKSVQKFIQGPSFNERNEKKMIKRLN